MLVEAVVVFLSFIRQTTYFHPTGLVAPTFILQPQNQTIEEGQRVVLSCKATGNPFPKLSWYKMGSNGTFLIHGQTLDISVVKITDRGSYTCVATNGVGRPLSTEAFLNVECKSKDCLNKIRQKDIGAKIN